MVVPSAEIAFSTVPMVLLVSSRSADPHFEPGHHHVGLPGPVSTFSSWIVPRTSEQTDEHGSSTRPKRGDGLAVARPTAAQVVPATLAGAVFALVGGICGYAGATFGHHLWSAGRCPTSSCAVQETPWRVGVAGALAGVV